MALADFLLRLDSCECDFESNRAEMQLAAAPGRFSIFGDVRQQADKSGTQDGLAHRSLILGAVTGAATGQNVPFAIDHRPQGFQILVVDVNWPW